jgi:hypothetical protein
MVHFSKSHVLVVDHRPTEGVIQYVRMAHLACVGERAHPVI